MGKHVPGPIITRTDTERHLASYHPHVCFQGKRGPAKGWEWHRVLGWLVKQPDHRGPSAPCQGSVLAPGAHLYKRPEFNWAEADTGSQQQRRRTGSVPGCIQASASQLSSGGQASEQVTTQSQVQSGFRAWAPDPGWDRVRQVPTVSHCVLKGPPASRPPEEGVKSADSHPTCLKPSESASLRVCASRPQMLSPLTSGQARSKTGCNPKGGGILTTPPLGGRRLDVEFSVSHKHPSLERLGQIHMPLAPEQLLIGTAVLFLLRV